jgi:hypothetical protein
MNNTPVENTNDVKITTKIYPMKYKNRKGFQVGNMKIKFDTKNAPFTSSDQVDLYLNELFSYIKWASTKKHPDDETVKDMKKTIHDFLKAKKIEHVFSPKVIVGKGIINKFEKILHLRPEYANYALNQIKYVKTEPYSVDIEEMKKQAESIIHPNKDKDN